MSDLTREIGTDNVSAIGLGVMRMSVFYGTPESDEERFKEKPPISPLKKPNNDPGYLKAGLENSLKKLGIDAIDLYYIARIQHSIPIEKTVAVMAEFVKSGKIKHIGLSECSAATLRRAHAIHPISAVQVEYSPFALDIEDNGLLKACRELGVTVVAYSPLGRGVLTGVYKSPDDFHPEDVRRRFPKYSKENFPNILNLVKVLEEVAKKYNATPGQVTLAWLLAQGNDIIPIPGTKTVKYLKENQDAAKIKLTADETGAISATAQKVETAAGGLARYPGGLLEGLFANTVEL